MKVQQIILLAMDTLGINTFIFISSILLICEASGECSHGQWECGSGDCIVRENVCNSKVDCVDGSDELNCKTESCDVFLFQCSDKKQCVSRVTVCNGKADCEDGSDEEQPDCDREDFVAVDNSHDRSSSSRIIFNYCSLILVSLFCLSDVK